MSSAEAEIPVRSADGKAALDIFYAEFNDINFYVEDDDQENLYEVILNKILPEISIRRIFPLGGKQAVLRHAASDTNERIDVFRAYLLDKDFDDFMGQQVQHPNIFYLDLFCIENYLLEESGLIEIVIENHPKKKRGEVSAQLAIQAATNDIFEKLRPLFVLFFCVQYCELPLKNCGASPEAFCRPKKLWEVDDRVVARYTAQVEEALLEKGRPPLDSLNLDPRVSEANCAAVHSLVSGKYVATLLFHYIKSQYSLGSMTFDSFIFRLAKNCSLHSLRALGERILKANAAR